MDNPVPVWEELVCAEFGFKNRGQLFESFEGLKVEHLELHKFCLFWWEFAEAG